MKWNKIYLVSTTLMLLYCNNLASQAGWIITNYKGSGNIMSGTPYYLKDVENGWHLSYKDRNFGINLGWKKQAQPNIVFEKSGGGEIKTGDVIALKVIGGEGYLKYESRTWGISLVWSKTPQYQWELRTMENKLGTTVRTDEPVGLVNFMEKDFMVYCVRSGNPVVDLGWFKDCLGGFRLPGGANNVKEIEWINIMKYGTPLFKVF